MIPATRIPILYRCKGYFLMWKYNGWHYWQFFSGDMKYLTDGEDYRTRAIRVVALSSGVVTKEQVSAIRTILHTREVYMWTDNGWSGIRVESGDAVVDRNTINAYEVQLRIHIGSRAVSYTGFSPVIIPPVILPSQEYCETMLIGNQVWMCRNYDAAIPGSKVYGNDEANAAIYGRLYSLAQIRTAGFLPYGWKFPTQADWQELIDYVGGDSVAAGILKELGTDHWLDPNDSTDEYEFTALPGGFFSALSFGGLNEQGLFWAKDSAVEAGTYVQMSYDSAVAQLVDGFITGNFLSVRLLKIIGESRSSVYGALYNWYAATDARNIAASGWRMPTLQDYADLSTELGGNSVAGGKLKEAGTTYWNTPNTGATNISQFSARGGGYRGEDGSFNNIKVQYFLWNAEGASLASGVVSYLASNSDDFYTSVPYVTQVELGKKVGCSVRLIKDATTLEDGQFGTYTGNDGTEYLTVCIGTQEWVAVNIIETKYRNGDTIPMVTDNAEWAALSTGAMCYYDNNEDNGFELVPDVSAGGGTIQWTADDETHTIDNSNLVGGDAQ